MFCGESCLGFKRLKEVERGLGRLREVEVDLAVEEF
jgi:hypothetical protein